MGLGGIIGVKKGYNRCSHLQICCRDKQSINLCRGDLRSDSKIAPTEFADEIPILDNEVLSLVYRVGRERESPLAFSRGMKRDTGTFRCRPAF